MTTRVLSPQRLTHYRDNWYLDAWCHKREDLRTFSIERIRSVKTVNTLDYGSIVNLNDKQLDAHYTQSFGIFGGKAINLVILKFTTYRAKWVSEEVWHKDQKSSWLNDGSYQLEMPYSNDLELISDILKYGEDVEVISPPELRNKIKQHAKNLMQMYDK